MKESAKRIATRTLYSALALLIPITAVILVGIAQGYRFDFKTGRVIGSGLAQIATQPRGAAILVDDEETGETSPERLILPAGEYELTLRKEGYRQWHKKISLFAAEVTWLKYPVLLLNTITTTTFDTVPQLKLWRQSADQKFVALVSTAKGRPQVKVFAPGQQAPPRLIYQVPDALLKQKAQIKDLVWAHDDEHLLVEMSKTGGTHYVIVDGVGSAEPVDVTGELKLPLAELAFDRKNWQELYWPSPEGLRKIDLGRGTVSSVLLTDIRDFTVSEDGVFAIQSDGKTAQIVQVERNGDTRTLVAGLDGTQGYHGLTHYDFDDVQHLAVALGKSDSVLVVSAILSDEPIKRTLSFNAAEIYASPKERFIVMRNAVNFATFDLDETRLHRFTLPFERVDNLSWFDKNHLLAVADGSVMLFEFDGGNVETIVDGVYGFAPLADREGKQIYSVGRALVSDNLLIRTSRVTE